MKNYLISVLLVFFVFALLMLTVWLVTYFPNLREGFAMFYNATPRRWEEIKEIYGAIWLSSVIVCPLMAIFVCPILEE